MSAFDFLSKVQHKVVKIEDLDNLVKSMEFESKTKIVQDLV